MAFLRFLIKICNTFPERLYEFTCPYCPVVNKNASLTAPLAILVHYIIIKESWFQSSYAKRSFTLTLFLPSPSSSFYDRSFVNFSIEITIFYPYWLVRGFIYCIQDMNALFMILLQMFSINFHFSFKLTIFCH